MATTTREKRLDLHQEAVSNLEKLAEDLATEGMPAHKIEQIIHKTIKQKMYGKFKETRGPSHIRHTLKNLFDDSKWAENKGPDSESEVVFRDILQRASIYHEFHKKIGPYTVDFFIPDDVIIELDGPHHDTPEQEKHDEFKDAWLKKKGYKVYRISTMTMFVMPTSTIIENVYSWIGKEGW